MSGIRFPPLASGGGGGSVDPTQTATIGADTQRYDFTLLDATKDVYVLKASIQCPASTTFYLAINGSSGLGALGNLQISTAGAGAVGSASGGFANSGAKTTDLTIIVTRPRAGFNFWTARGWGITRNGVNPSNTEHLSWAWNSGGAAIAQIGIYGNSATGVGVNSEFKLWEGQGY